MGRYRKIQVRTWGDEKFRSLTAIPPCGQGLWFFLLTGPHTGPIPGLFRAGRSALAEDLGWSVEAFDKAFREVFREGMAKADFEARIMWIPNALKHNKPESPNVVISWGAEFDLLPECPLKSEAYDAIKDFVISMGEPYEKAFEKAFTKPFVKASAKALPKAMPNQEQEQEQEQEQNRMPPEFSGASNSISPVPNGSLEPQAAPPISNQEADLFRRGKDLLGASSGGLIKKLLLAKNGNVAMARAAIETAATKENPREYLGAIIRNRDSPEDLRARGEAW